MLVVACTLLLMLLHHAHQVEAGQKIIIMRPRKPKQPSAECCHCGGHEGGGGMEDMGGGFGDMAGGMFRRRRKRR